MQTWFNRPIGGVNNISRVVPTLSDKAIHVIQNTMNHTVWQITPFAYLPDCWSEDAS